MTWPGATGATAWRYWCSVAAKPNASNEQLHLSPEGKAIALLEARRREMEVHSGGPAVAQQVRCSGKGQKASVASTFEPLARISHA